MKGEAKMEKETIKEKILESIGFDTPMYPYDLIKKTLLALKMKRTDENVKLVDELIDELKKEKTIETVISINRRNRLKGTEETD